MLFEHRSKYQQLFNNCRNTLTEKKNQKIHNPYKYTPVLDNIFFVNLSLLFNNQQVHLFFFLSVFNCEVRALKCGLYIFYAICQFLLGFFLATSCEVAQGVRDLLVGGSLIYSVSFSLEMCLYWILSLQLRPQRVIAYFIFSSGMVAIELFVYSLV